MNKAANKTNASASPRSSGGENAVTMTPPDYGIGFVDSGMVAAAPVQLVAATGGSSASISGSNPTPNRTGLPDKLKAGVEGLSGMDLSDVRVYYNSAKPAQIQAHAYTQGSEIHVGPGQEQHLPHESWHVVQQRQGRVQPTFQTKSGVAINDSAALESEADRMGEMANNLSQAQNDDAALQRQAVGVSGGIVQRVAITRSMAAAVESIASAEELKHFLAHSNYSDEVISELKEYWKSKGKNIEPVVDEADFVDDEIQKNDEGHEGYVLDDMQDEETERHGVEMEVSLNKPQVQDVAMGDVEEEKDVKMDVVSPMAMGHEVQRKPFAVIQRARTPGAMTGPKDFTASNGAQYKDSFYILGKPYGDLDFSVDPNTQVNVYKNYTHPKTGKKPASFKHNKIQWQDPHYQQANSVVDLPNKVGKVKLDTRNRSQHFGWADAILAKRLGKKPKYVRETIRKGKFTWHHLETPHYMVLVDMKVHAKHGHNGGVHIWK